MKQNLYHFMNTWHIPVDKITAENAILDMKSWKQWWLGLEKGETTKPKLGIIGTKIRAEWKSMFGYKIGILLTITGYKPGEYITFQSKGDLMGEGSWTYRSARNSGTNMDITWNVSTTKTWMNVFGLVLRPVFVFAHGSLMNQGEQGLNQYLKK